MLFEETAAPEAVLVAGVNNNGCCADVEADTIFTFCAVVAVPVNEPVIIPLFIVTPEIAVAEATYKLPPIPTPPVTINAPEDVETDAVDAVIDIPDAKVLLPRRV